MNQLLKKDVKFIWSEKQQEAFELLKEKLCEESLLQRPDFAQPFILTTDASGFTIGGILSQGKIGKDKPIAYTSRSLNNFERKYDAYEKEALAIIYCVTYFRPYLYGRKLTLVTDHKPLIWFQNSKDPCSRVTRWKLKLAEYDFDVIYKAGKTNVNADALSRNPIDLENIENDDINNKNNIEINLIEQKNAKCISDLKYHGKVPETDIACYEEIDYVIIEEKVENNFKKIKEFINEENWFKNNNNQRSYDELKYIVIEDENINNDNFGGNKQILTNDGNLNKDIKNKKYNDDIHYGDIENQKISEHFGEIEQLYEETLLKNVGHYKRYNNDNEVDVEKIDKSETEEIKQLLNEEYLLKNDNDNDEKCYIELDFKDIKEGRNYENNEKTIEQLNEEDLFNIINKRLINIIMNKMKNKGNRSELINEQNISQKFVSQFLKCVMDSIRILLENKNKCYAMQTRSRNKKFEEYKYG